MQIRLYTCISKHVRVPKIISIYASCFKTFTVSNSVVVPRPESLNVTDGSTATFTCGTFDPRKELTWNTNPLVKKPTENRTTLQSGLQLVTLSFTATTQRNHTNVTCIIFNDTTAVNAVALLLVQGTYV